MLQKEEKFANYFELWWLILNIRDIIFRLREKELIEKCDLSVRESVVLINIDAINAEGKDATPAELARRILRQPNSTAYLLDRMQKRGLIKQTRGLDRKNLIKVTVTEKGRQAYACSRKRDSINRMMEFLSDEELTTVIPILDKFYDNLLEMTGRGARKRTI